MPCVCRFNGISIYFYPREGRHQKPHFHVRLKNMRLASIEIESGELLAGSLVKLNNRQEKLLRQWIREHRGELLKAWEQARTGVALDSIPPPVGASP